MKDQEIIIIGAGASGLMAAKELAKAGKRVLVLEARDRIGGRIWPLPEEEFGYKAQGGAEFIHGEAAITKSLIRESGLTLIPMDGEVWSVRGSEITKSIGGPTNDPEFLAHKDILHEKLQALAKDVSIAEFLDNNFSEEKYAGLRNWIIKMVEGYDAADPRKISSFALREEWLGGEEWQQGKIKEGYGALLIFLESQCRNNRVEINLNHEVESISLEGSNAYVKCTNGKEFKSEKAIITLALPTINRISFNPPIPEKIVAASKIGFGKVIKFLLQFKTEWWKSALGRDLNKLMFMLCNGKITAWWTQYPESYPVLTGWIPGLVTEEFKNTSSEDILKLAVKSLSDSFKVSEDFVREQLVGSRIINWPADPFSMGAYSYTTLETKEAYEELIKPIDNKIFFAGEALYSGKETATVEGALASGKETAEKIIKNNV